MRIVITTFLIYVNNLFSLGLDLAGGRNGGKNKGGNKNKVKTKYEQ